MSQSASTREQAKQYLAAHRIPQMFESLLSCLMIERPDDPVSYVEKKMAEIKHIGIDKVNWETFVFHIHPYRHPVRLSHIHDGSKFDREREHKERLLEGIWRLYQEGQLTDITLVADGREFKCNRNVLAASSPYFR